MYVLGGRSSGLWEFRGQVDAGVVGPKGGQFVQEV